MKKVHNEIFSRLWDFSWKAVRIIHNASMKTCGSMLKVHKYIRKKGSKRKSKIIMAVDPINYAHSQEAHTCFKRKMSKM